MNVLEVDINNRRYSLKYNFAEPVMTTSDVMKKTDVVGVVNATYEAGFVFIRIDGITYYAIRDAFVMDTHVPRWRNDGGVFCDASGNKVMMEHTGRNLE